MKPQLYSIVILLLTSINYGQNTSTQAATVSGTPLPPVPNDNTTSVAKTTDVTVTKAPDDHRNSVPEIPKDNITLVTTTPKDNITLVTTTSKNNITLVTTTPKDNITLVTTTPKDNITLVTTTPKDNITPVITTPKDNITSVTTAPKGNTTSITKTFSEAIVSEIPTDKTTFFSEAPNSQAASTPSLAPNVSLVRTTKGFTVTTRSGGTPKATRSTSILKEKQTSNPGNATTPRNNKVTAPVRKTTRLTSTKSTTANGTSALPVPLLFAVMLLVVSVLRF